MTHPPYSADGATGALLDEYRKAIAELIFTIENLTPVQLTKIVDTSTKDPDCVSVQSVLSHVVGSGCRYVITIRRWLGDDVPDLTNELLPTASLYVEALERLFAYTVQLFIDYPQVPLEVLENDKKITVRWGQQYDVEQLLEHAIVHVLRHRRQIVRWLPQLTTG